MQRNYTRPISPRSFNLKVDLSRDTNQYIDPQYIDQYIDIANINIENLIDLYPWT